MSMQYHSDRHRQDLLGDPISHSIYNNHIQVNKYLYVCIAFVNKREAHEKEKLG
jgi:hypothetical protein